MMKIKSAALVAALFCACSIQQLSAAELYGGVGLPGISAGIAQAIDRSFTVRADYTGLPSMTYTRTEDGVRYDGQTTFHRLGLFADWFALGNGFRLTGGLTLNRIHLDLLAQPENNTITIGDTAYPVGPDDRFNARVEYPRVMPYLGIGWGHMTRDAGWGFHADLGVAIGRPKVTGQASGALAAQPGIQENTERELAQLRDTADRYRVVPQLSIGVSYTF